MGEVPQEMMMANNNSELIGCDLTWRRDGAAWVLFHKRRRMGRVVLDNEHPGMYRVALARGRLSDMANATWAKDAVLAAAVRELEWEANHRAIDPPKRPEKRPVFASSAPLIDSKQEPAGWVPVIANSSVLTPISSSAG
jgi:hypothetical protein